MRHGNPWLGQTPSVSPEKALLDLFYLSRGEFPLERIEELRLEGLDRLDGRQLLSMARLVAAPRVLRAVRNLLRWLGHPEIEVAG
ncbi:MAG: hypothetical protein FJZ01_19430 [Candidatus Sericytochromatia bacterium]|nr:hypothetical protein [Candidatus Tanganyikabacteria bacterium]